MIAIALETALIGKQQLIRFLTSPMIQETLRKTDVQDLMDSISAYPNQRRSIPLSLAADALFRFAVVIQELKPKDENGYSPALIYAQLAVKCYDVLIYACNKDKHPFQFSAIDNCRELACIERDKIIATHALVKANLTSPKATEEQLEFRAEQTDYKKRHSQMHLTLWKPKSILSKSTYSSPPTNLSTSGLTKAVTSAVMRIKATTRARQ